MRLNFAFQFFNKEANGSLSHVYILTWMRFLIDSLSSKVTTYVFGDLIDNQT